MNQRIDLSNIVSGEGRTIGFPSPQPSITVGYGVVDSASRISARFRQAQTLHQQGKWAEARQLYESIVLEQPEHFGAWHFLGVLAAQDNQFDRAIELIGKSILLNSHSALAYNNYGNALRGAKLYQSAVQSYEKAIQIDCKYADAFLNRAIALADVYELNAALESIDRAIEIDPAMAEAHFNRGVILKALNEIDAALGSFDRAIAIDPRHREAQFARVFALLLAGNFRLGWEAYECREAVARSLEFPGKDSLVTRLRKVGTADIAGARVLIYSEQGLGDTLQFCRYAKRVAELGAEVILEAPQSLLTLLADLDGVTQLVAKGASLPSFDCYCPLMSLPLAFDTDLTNIPSGDTYLRAETTRVADWLAKLPPTREPRIGLVWSGSAAHVDDRNRSIPLAELVRYLPKGFQYISLQNDIRESDLGVGERQVLDFSHALIDFRDTAALCANMDFVISVDTSVAHLTGALGIDTWLLVPFAPDWRWLLGRADSPWYPSVTIHRQDRPRDWSGVLRRVKANLEAYATVGHER